MIHTSQKIVMTSFKLQRATKEVWETLNPVLLDGEPGYEKDTNKLKIGDGKSNWLELEYLGEGSSVVEGAVTKIVIADDVIEPAQDGTVVLPTAEVGKVGLVSICDGLCTEGAAADAKAVGDKISEVETVIQEISEDVTEVKEVVEDLKDATVPEELVEEVVKDVLSEVVFIAGGAE